MKALTVTRRFEEQSAFVGMLTRPLLTPANEPELHRLVMRHQRQLAEWFRRLGYRLVVVGQVARLHRSPQAGGVAAPPLANPPKRRELVLTLAAAAACEEGEGTTTLQDLSDQVRMITSVPSSPVSAYDPELRPERSALLLAVRRLESHGVLVRRTRDEDMLQTWEAARVGIGAGYDIDRAALLQLLDPHTAALAAPGHRQHEDGDLLVGTRWTRMLRILIETPALHYADLSDEDAAYARGVAGRLAEAASTMTGGSVELRAEGMVLTLPPEHPWTGAATLDWPKTSAAAWIALMLCDAAGATGHRTDSGSVLIPSEQVDRLADALHQRHHGELAERYRKAPEAIRPTAQAILVDAGLLQVDARDGWVLKPAAARYRDSDPSRRWYQTTSIPQGQAL